VAEVTGDQPAGRRLFVRQSSGLVREVSVMNALFFNTAAFIGGGVGGYPAFYALAFLPVGLAGGISTYAWASIIVGGFCVVLGLIFASLTSVMPRSGGDYVFTSRFIPKAGPFIGWLESFTLVFASLAIIAFEVNLTLRNLQMSGRIIGIGTGVSFFNKANSWFASGGVITGWPGFLGGLIVLALIFWVVIQPTRRLHRIVTGLAALALLSAVVMFIFGVAFLHQSSFESNLPKYTGTTLAQIHKAAVDNGIAGHGVDFHPSIFAFFMTLVLFNYIGFQYSAYIAGEVRGNVKRSILLAVLGALVIAVLMNSFYNDIISKRLGFETQLGWGWMFWFGDPKVLPLGQPNFMPLMGAISSPHLWPIWLFVSFGSMLFPFLLCPVYLNFISRISLAWSLDRQVPEWFGRVNERLRAPINAILTGLGVCVLLVAASDFPLVPKSLTALGDGKLNLAGTAWFSILLALLTWVMPGVNAIVSRFSRPDLVRSAPWSAWLPLFGVIWLVFAGGVYWFAGIKAVIDSFHNFGGLSYLNAQGVTLALVIYGLGIVIYAVQSVRNRVKGIDMAMLYREIPPD
jgi:amino acid transporter